MKKTILLSVMSAALFAMGTASAGGGSLFGSSGESSMMSGLYVGGSYGQATTNCMISDALYQDKDCKSDGWKEWNFMAIVKLKYWIELKIWSSIFSQKNLVMPTLFFKKANPMMMFGQSGRKGSD